ncbi:MAG: hypothetical protein SF052_18650 [Bacteroidia bacterium]|nr:hypothetical protein [Bacteroidia bacterium]
MCFSDWRSGILRATARRKREKILGEPMGYKHVIPPGSGYALLRIFPNGKKGLNTTPPESVHLKNGPYGYKHTTPPESGYALLSYFSQREERVKYDSGGVKCL